MKSDNNVFACAKSNRIYNVLFPVWLFYLYPTGLWLMILPANFVIDSAVLFFSMKRIPIPNPNVVWKRSILRVWSIGFICDLIGAALILVLELLIDAAHLNWNTFLFPGATLIAIPGVTLAGYLIYVLDRRYAFKRCALRQEHVHRLSLALAVFTAPYAMLIPLYG